MAYKLRILRRAQRELRKLPVAAYERVRDAIRRLAADPRPSGCKKLTGREGWRIRIGSYRVIYEVADKDRVVTVLDIGNRRDIYK